MNKPNPVSKHCLDPRGCSPTDCCLIITTTPVPTTTPLPGTTPYARKYSDQQDAMVHTVVASEKETNTHTWLMFALFAAGGLAVTTFLAYMYRRERRSSRRVDIVALEDGLEMSDGDGIVE